MFGFIQVEPPPVVDSPAAAFFNHALFKLTLLVVGDSHHCQDGRSKKTRERKR
jgi:hypothetical protein